MKKRAVVTGCAGFIGSTLCKYLDGKGFEVVGIDSMTDYYPRVMKEQNLFSIQSRRFTFSESNVAFCKIPDADIIFHLAGQPGVRASWGNQFFAYLDDNINATQILLERVKERKIHRFVYASSSSVYGEVVEPGEHTYTKTRLSEDMALHPRSPYGITKLAAENLCMTYGSEFGMPVTALRFFSVYGPRQRPDMAFRKFFECIRTDKPIAIYGSGKQIRDFTYVGDVVRIIYEAAMSDKAVDQVLNVGGGSPVSLSHAIDIIEQVIGREVGREYTKREKGDVHATEADTQKLRDTLGPVEFTSIEEGLKSEWEWVNGS